jgi:diguanylate cyclase (GGDEF)-like protein
MTNERQSVLIVEDSKTFSSMMHHRITQELGLDAVVAATLAETREIVAVRADQFFVALLDMNLPDAPNGEVLDLVPEYGIPSIVFTGYYSDALREKILALNVVDYVPKEGGKDVDYILKLIARLRKNRFTKILVVDDSPSARLFIVNMLRLRNFQALEAGNGKQAMAVLERHPDVKLVISDCYMPEMDGFELTRQLRTTHTREKMSIIGISAQGSGSMSAKFLKTGANDFLSKPFIIEEFFCRIDQNLDAMEYIEEIRFLSERDYLTGLGNRRYFFDAAPKVLAAARREHQPVSITMLDIDYFKKVNDTYGHDGGDAALRHIAQFLREFEAPRTLVTRFGGEEFCIMFVDTAGDASRRMENLRRRIESSPVPWQEGSFSFTISLGHLHAPAQELEAMLAQADKLLYEAKETGRNRLVERLIPMPPAATG